MGSAQVELASRVPLEDSAQALFLREWQTYRKMVDHNYLFHREAYDRLHRFLVEEVAEPFRFLDVACGDAIATVRALAGTRIAHYHGIDQSPAALALARESLTALSCPVVIEQSDFVDALSKLPAPADVVWIGLSLHHLHTPKKLAVLRSIREIVGERGRLLIYEDVSRNGEDRASWLRRWDAHRPSWLAFTDEEWDAVTAHVHAADFPETIAGWHELSHVAGFGNVQELFVAPTDLLRMYCFHA